MREAPLLIIDDLGAHSASNWAQEKLFQLLNHRYNAQLPTVITTNQRLENMDQRLRSRMVDIHLVERLAITAPDFRAGANPAHSELSSLGLHRNQNFSSFDVPRSDLTTAQKNALRQSVTVVEAFAHDPQGWLVLTGAYGCGKTHLAAAVANFRWIKGRPMSCLWWPRICWTSCGRPLAPNPPPPMIVVSMRSKRPPAGFG